MILLSSYTSNTLDLPPIRGFMNFFSFATFFTWPSKCKIQGTSRPPYGKLAEYLVCPVTRQVIKFPLLTKIEQARDMFCSRCPMIVPSFFTVTAYLSLTLSSSLLRWSSSPINASQTFLYIWLTMHTAISFTDFHPSKFLSMKVTKRHCASHMWSKQLLVTKIVVKNLYWLPKKMKIF